MKIVVVGGGVSGLTCAVALLEAGAEVVVLTAGAPAGTVSAVAGATVVSSGLWARLARELSAGSHGSATSRVLLPLKVPAAMPPAGGTGSMCRWYCSSWRAGFP